MRHAAGKSVRFCIVLLLFLGISPVTAPFLTCDLATLLGGPSADATAILQSKASADEPVASSSLEPSSVILSAREALGHFDWATGPDHRITLPFPLRL